MDNRRNCARFLLTFISHSRWALIGGLISVCACCPPQDATTPVENPGLFGVLQSEVTVSRPDGSTFAAVIYYPVQMDKEGTPASRIAYPVPAISFGHAYLISPEMDSAVVGCDTGSISRTEQLAVTWERLEAFFDLYLSGSPEARERLLAPSPPGEPQVVIHDELLVSGR